MNWTSLKWIKLRILVVSVGFVVFLCLILFRSYQLQIADDHRVDKQAKRQYRARLSVQPKRGTIYDRNGKVLAMDLEVASVAVRPPQVKDVEKTVTALAPILSMPPEKIREKVTSSKKFEYIIRGAPQEVEAQIAALKLEGISTEGEYKRFYPNKELAGNLLGAVGLDAKALGGLELAYDEYLKSGKQDNLVATKDARGRVFTPVEAQEAQHDLYLTIDSNIQFIAEKYLWENAQKYNVKNGFAIVMEPHSGELLAMANYPPFNPNAYRDYPPEHWKNHAVIDSFEPGSTFKAFIAAAALDSGKIGLNDKFYCENGEYRIGNHVIHDHSRHGYLNITEIIQVSSNIGVTKVAMKVGKEPFYDTITRFGFGANTGLGLPSESRGVLSNVRRWSDLEQSNIAFGQGVAVSGLQMAQAYAALANGGSRMKPLLVSRIVGNGGEVVAEFKPEKIDQIIAPESAKQMTSVLEKVADPSGTGKLAMLEGYAVAGKTGTAQKVDPKTHRYADGQYISSFIGYIPAHDPQYVIYVVYDTPRPEYYGGTVAAPVFRNIAGYALSYAGVAPEKTQVAKTDDIGGRKGL